MSAIVDEIRRPAAQALQATTGWQGVVHKGATDMSTKIDVIVPGIDVRMPITGCRWQARDASSKPAPGDIVFLQFDDRGEPWVNAWWPAGFDAE